MPAHVQVATPVALSASLPTPLLDRSPAFLVALILRTILVSLQATLTSLCMSPSPCHSAPKPRPSPLPAQEYGISVNNDTVVRTTHYKYLHPKEVLIADGILNRGLLTAVGKPINSNHDVDELDLGRNRKLKEAFANAGLDFVYPYGSTLSVQKPAIPVLSSGKIAYPMNRPLGERGLGTGLGPASGRGNGSSMG